MQCDKCKQEIDEREGYIKIDERYVFTDCHRNSAGALITQQLSDHKALLFVREKLSQKSGKSGACMKNIILVTLLVLIFSCPSFAGIRMSTGSSAVTIPKFSSREQAVQWAHDIGYSPELLSDVQARLRELERLKRILEEKRESDSKFSPVEYIDTKFQVFWLKEALDVIEGMKRSGKYGATVFSGSIQIN